ALPTSSTTAVRGCAPRYSMLGQAAAAAITSGCMGPVPAIFSGRRKAGLAAARSKVAISFSGDSLPTNRAYPPEPFPGPESGTTLGFTRIRSGGRPAFLVKTDLAYSL